MTSINNILSRITGGDCCGDGERPCGVPAPPSALLPPCLPPLLRVHLTSPSSHQLQHQLPHILCCCKLLRNFENIPPNMFLFSGNALPHLHQKKIYVHHKVAIYKMELCYLNPKTILQKCQLLNNTITAQMEVQHSNVPFSMTTQNTLTKRYLQQNKRRMISLCTFGAQAVSLRLLAQVNVFFWQKPF